MRRAVGMRNRDREAKRRQRARQRSAFGRLPGTPAGAHMQLDRPETNEVRVLTVVPIYAESDSRSRLEPNPAGGYGRYEVVFVLGIPGSDTFDESLDLAALDGWGDSLIITGRSDIVEVRVELIPAGGGTSQLPEIRIKTNGQGALAQARVSVDAQDFDNAQRLAHDVIAPL